jgi:hypothetical protein
MNYRLSILFFVLVVCSFAACKKQNYAVPNPPSFPPALDVVNATADTLDYFINGTRQNNYSDIYPNGATDYLNVLFGTQSYSFKKAGSQITLFKQSYTLDTASNGYFFYSLFVCGESSANTFLTPDNLSQAAGVDTLANTAAVRFVNASPNAGNLDVVVSIGTSLSITNCAFKSVSSFKGLRDTVNDIKVYASGTTQLLKDTSVTFYSGQAYTLFSKGTPGGKGGAAFGLVVISSDNIIYTQTD